jgi:tRNA (guanine-N7-)-methyltransferase
VSASKPARRRHRKHGNPFSIRGPLAAPEAAHSFARVAPFALDVGFGEGSFLLELAQRRSEWNVLGLEIRTHLVEDLNAAARAQGLSNALAVLANANVHLDDLVPDRSVVFVAINFPDPWYKTRHKKRRVVRPEWIEVLMTKLAPGAEIHAMTDYEPVAAQMRDAFAAYPAFTNLNGPRTYAQTSSTGILTERERKHTRRNEPVYRLHLSFGG